MNYSEIPFVENQFLIGSRMGLVKNHHWLHKVYFDRLWRSAREHLLRFDPSSKLDTETLYGNTTRWRELRFGTRIAYGRVLKFFVEHGMLPLREINKGKKGKRIYALIQ